MLSIHKYHWLNRPIVPNLLREGVDLFEIG